MKSCKSDPDEGCFQRKADTTRELDPRVAVSCPDTQRPTAFGTFNFDQTRASAV